MPAPAIDTLRDVRYIVGQLCGIKDARDGRPPADVTRAPVAYALGYAKGFAEEAIKHATSPGTMVH